MGQEQQGQAIAAELEPEGLAGRLLSAKRQRVILYALGSRQFKASLRQRACGLACWVFFFLVSANYADAEETPVTVRIATQHTPAMATFPPLALFKNRVEEGSAGGIRVEIHHSAQLFSDTQIGPAVASGAIEMGIADLSRYADAIPAADVFQLPFVFNTEGLEKRATAAGSEIRALIDDAIAAQFGVRVLWWTSLGQTVFESKGISVADPEKIAGRSVRTVGPTTSAVVTKCGGRPVDIPGPDLEKAFETQKVDIAMTGISTVLGRQLWRYMDTLTRSNHSSVQFVAVINGKFWEGLTERQKTIVGMAAQAAGEEARRVISEIEGKTYNELRDKHGMKIFELTQEQLTLWRICSSDVLQQYVDKSGPLGAAVMRAYGRMLAEPTMPVSPQRP